MAAAEHPYNRGCDALASGHVGKAAAFFKAAVKLDPSDTDALNNLAVCYIMTRQYVQAVPLLQKVLRLNGRYRGADLNIGAAYIFQDKFGQGLPSTRRAQNTPATAIGKRVRASAFYNLGLVAAREGRYANAKTAFQQSVAASPAVATELALASVQCVLGDYGEGIPALEKISTSGPGGAVAQTIKANLAAAYYQRGMAKLNQRDLRGAETDLTKSSQMAANGYARMGLAVVDAERGDLRAAADVFNDISQSSGAPQLKQAATANLDRLKSMADRSSRWLKLLILIGGAVLFGSQAASLMRARRESRRRGAVGRVKMACGIVAGIVAAAILLMAFLDPFRTTVWVLVTVGVDLAVIVIVWAGPTEVSGVAEPAGSRGSG